MTTIDDLIEYFDAMAAKAAEIGVVDRSIDHHTLAHLRELKALRETVTHLRESNRLLQLRDDYVTACLV
jgi:hypothetical protein